MRIKPMKFAGVRLDIPHGRDYHRKIAPRGAMVSLRCETEKGTPYEALIDEHRAVEIATELLELARTIRQHWRDAQKEDRL